MPASAVRVVAPFSGRGVYVFSLILGAYFGLAMLAEEGWAFNLPQSPFILRHLTSGQANTLALVLTIGAALIPGALIGLWLSCLSQRRGQIAVAAALAGAAELLTSLLADKVLRSADGGADWHDWPLAAFLINLAIIAATSAGAALLIRWLVRSLLFTTIDQDGTRCTRCGYQLGSPLITTCPECGTPAGSARLAFARLHRASRWLQRRAPVLIALLGAAVLLQLGVTIHFRTLPALRFLTAFPRTENAGPGVMVARPAPPGSYDSSCLAAWIALPDGSSRAVIILYVPDQRSPLPPMRLALAATPGPPPATGVGFQANYGTPEIGCDLPRDLAERIIREGVPRALIQALAAEAGRANWTPTPAPVGVFFATDQAHWIDPAPYFSAR